MINNQETTKEEDVTCPFCKEEGFDLGGLKTHLEHGDCDKYNEAEGYTRLLYEKP